MIFNRTHRRGATALAVMALAGLLPGPVFADAPAQQVVPPPIEAQTPPPLDQEILAVVPPVVMIAPPVEAPASTAVIGQGMASYYGAELAGNRTANGERFNPNALTAAHRTLPMGTKLRV
ncbi:MAG: septal ring lytic transglycosylase RlpA family lipoprotein, partial [Pseudomonadota bacterium]|nr:septal ring lytic transglycosylase RlpA family lipoprotein [Pseudomonadota bacterium]